MKTILISGAASGLGKAYLDAVQHENVQVIAIDRCYMDHVDRMNLRSFEVDVSSHQSIATFADHIRNVPIHLVFHSAGVRGLVPCIAAEKPEDVAAAETMHVMDLDTMMSTFQINTAGTFMLLQALMENFKLGSKEEPAKVIIIGSRMGSVGYNSTGGGYAYRASKAGLNAIIKSFSIDVPEVIFTTLHPGRVETGLVASREEGAIEAEESVDEMLKVISKLTLEDSGKFYDRFGDPIVW
jgi:NAD(P)-dependent dehydrogenase (short-subunit alcohol dehydrogenase family)